MTETTKTKHVYKAINDVKKLLAKHGGITKDRTPETGSRYSFRGIDDMYNVLCGLTAEAGLVMIPRVVSNRIDYGQTKAGGAQTHVFLEVEVDFCSEHDGSMHTGRFFGEAIDTSDKAANKATSAAFKYAHLTVFQIPTHGESDDTENQSHPVSAPQAQRPIMQQAPPPRDPMAPQVESGALLPTVPTNGAPAPEQARRTRGPNKPKDVPSPAPPPAVPHTPAEPTPPGYPVTGAQTVNAAGIPVANIPPAFRPEAEPLEPPFPDGAGGGEDPAGELLGRIGDINTFPLLFAIAQDADKHVEPGRTELFTAIRAKAVDLFARASDMPFVQEGFALVTALGQPDDLKRAANQAYARFRQ